MDYVDNILTWSQKVMFAICINLCGTLMSQINLKLCNPIILSIEDVDILFQAVTMGTAEFSLMEVLTTPTMSVGFTLRYCSSDDCDDELVVLVVIER